MMASQLQRIDRVSDETLSEEADQYLAFRTREERFALPIGLVREIIEYGTLTPVPMMPEFIRGVINLRGHVVPVIDLASRFGMGVTEPGKRTCIIIMEVEEGDTTLILGLVVDAVDSVFDLDPGDIEPPPRFGAGIRADFIAGMVKSEAGFVVLLDVGHVLSTEDMKRLAESSHLGERLLTSEADSTASR
ncbi:chemotaxis protein CheW [Marinobacteraceae bacterium S3BR75-40.1]